MKDFSIDYSALIDEAMHLIVKKSLQFFAASNYNSDHHFFISFITNYPGVSISDWLREHHPNEMTIVLQHSYSDLKVNDDNFSVTLSFNRKPEKLVIPFTALTAFADPSVKFGLQFRQTENESGEDGKKVSTTVITSTKSQDNKAPAKPIETNGNVITLDFRNKKRI